MDLWNKKHLPSPPINTVKMKRGNLDLAHLKSILDDSLEIFESKHLLHREAAVLSRFVYKSKRRFRGHKFLMYLEKIYRGLKRYLSLNLEEVYDTFSSLLTCADNSEQYDKSVYIPTRQMLEYLLVRTQGFSKIMFYISNSCQIAAYHALDKIRQGHILTDSMMVFSLVSRIWYCSRYYIISASRWYSQLLPYLEKLKVAGICWLPEGYKFPSNIETWLGPDSLTGELMSVDNEDLDVVQIVQDIKKFEEKDCGKKIDRDEFAMLLKRKQNMDEATTNASYKTKYDKLLKMASETPLKSDSMMPCNEMSSNLGEFISRDKFISTRSITENSVDVFAKPIEHSTTYNKLLKTVSDTPLKSQSTKYSGDNQKDYGDVISRDQFSSLKPRTENVSVVSDLRGDVGQPTKYNKLLNTGSDTSIKLHSSKSCRAFETKRNTVKYGENNINDFEEEIAHDEFLAQSSKSSSLPLSEESRLHRIKKSKSARKKLKGTSVSMETENKSFVSTDKKESLQETFSFSTESHNIDSGDRTFDVQNVSQYISASKRQKNTNIAKKKSVHVKTLPSPKSVPKVISVSKDHPNIKDISTVSKDTVQCSSNRPIIKKKPADSVKIINEIKSVNDLKVFLSKEKKARTKGKNCITSHLDKSEWNTVVVTVNKILKKTNILKTKGNRQNSAALGEIRNCLLSLIT